jgi:integrase/recombinase XerD
MTFITARAACRSPSDLARRRTDRSAARFKPMLAGFATQRPRGRPGRLPECRRLPRVLSLSQVEAILRAQRRVRDRFLFALLFQTGMRVGQALGLRHEDVVTWENRIEIVCRENNANGARGKR